MALPIIAHFSDASTNQGNAAAAAPRPRSLRMLRRERSPEPSEQMTGHQVLRFPWHGAEAGGLFLAARLRDGAARVKAAA